MDNKILTQKEWNKLNKDYQALLMKDIINKVFHKFQMIPSVFLKKYPPILRCSLFFRLSESIKVGYGYPMHDSVSVNVSVNKNNDFVMTQGYGRWQDKYTIFQYEALLIYSHYLWWKQLYEKFETDIEIHHRIKRLSVLMKKYSKGRHVAFEKNILNTPFGKTNIGKITDVAFDEIVLCPKIIVNNDQWFYIYSETECFNVVGMTYGKPRKSHNLKIHIASEQEMFDEVERLLWE